MKQGLVVEHFDVKGKNGEKLRVVFRYPSKQDVTAAVKMVNMVRDETDFLGQRHHETIKTERLFIETQIRNMRKRKGLCLFVEVNGKLAGDSVIRSLEFDFSSHVGRLGIMIEEQFTGLGIGTRLVQKMLELAKKQTMFKVIGSSVVSKNVRSRKLQKKFGFKQYGLFPKEILLRDGTYCDHVYLYKVIKEL